MSQTTAIDELQKSSQPKPFHCMADHLLRIAGIHPPDFFINVVVSNLDTFGCSSVKTQPACINDKNRCSLLHDQDVHPEHPEQASLARRDLCHTHLAFAGTSD